MTLTSHLGHLLIYSTLVSTFFAVLVRRERREQIRMFAWTWVGMVGGAMALAFLMFPFPR